MEMALDDLNARIAPFEGYMVVEIMVDGSQRSTFGFWRNKSAQ
jgi:hypothetical protein